MWSVKDDSVCSASVSNGSGKFEKNKYALRCWKM